MIDPLKRQLLNSLNTIILGGLAVVVMPKVIPGVTRGAGAPMRAQKSETVAERLGYRADDKLLIVHADDLGVAHSVNAASIKALETGSVSSASIMVTCPWLTEIADYAKAHPQEDLGLHLTLTSEWALYRWGPVSPRDQVPSLVGPDGYLYSSEFEAVQRISPREAEIEIRAQIERARAFGINPTHLDSHMGVLFKTRELFEVLLRAGHDYKLPVLIFKDLFPKGDIFASSLEPEDIVLDQIITIAPTVSGEHWADFYIDAIKRLKPGVTEFLVHLAHDDEEMRAVTSNHPEWGAAWRQRDFDFFTSDLCRNLLTENQVKVITWREIGKLLRK